ncbi:MAG: substrate-binding domain-containing protein, partial [Pseudomonadota bacterium]
GAALVEALGRDLLQYDALVCVSDPVAFGVLSGCRRLGLDVPRDIAVTGFGNFEIASVSEPRITTVDVNARAIGVEVAAVLGAALRGGVETKRIDVGSRLVLGETSH